MRLVKYFILIFIVFFILDIIFFGLFTKEFNIIRILLSSLIFATIMTYFNHFTSKFTKNKLD
ncbi:hypothetical protein BU065_13015 [Staphylococcus succinus]|nr:hypothetical protein BU065_13015 [Staphylococcus succinus]